MGKPADPTSRTGLGYTIDFTNPDAVGWYEGMLERVLKMGASAIKADFGESIDTQAVYMNATAAKYGHLFPLLYQRAVWEATHRVKAENIEWARSGWAGSQRYPVHWGGDPAGTFDGLAGTICGGAHLGLSGFGFWSHDIPGTHGIPHFWTTKPSPELYIRWTRWEYSALTCVITARHTASLGNFLRFPILPGSGCVSVTRCCPTFSRRPNNAAEAATRCFGPWYSSGPTIRQSGGLRTSICWVNLSWFARCFTLRGTRDVYLPEAKWVDFWNGGVLTGPQRLKDVKSPLSRLPLYVRYGSKIEFAEPVQYTDLLAHARKFSILFDNSYPGFDGSELKSLISL